MVLDNSKPQEKNRARKYMFISTTLANGGAERVISILASSIAKVGRETCIVKYYELENEYTVDERVKIINLSGGCFSDYRQISFIERIKRLRHIIEKENPDFIIPFLFQVALCTDFATRGLKTTVIQSIRINPALAPASRLWRRLRDHLVYKSKCTFVQNKSQLEYFKPSHHRRIHVLFNPISEELIDAEWKPDEKKYIVCGVGRIEPQKNFRLLIDAFKDAFEDKPDVVLHIYGEGSLYDDLKKYISNMKMDDRIQMKGRNNDIKNVYQSASLFVLSSDFEGMPNALIEAMAVGVPCISTDCPTGPNDLISNGKNGLLVPMQDKVAMVEAMKSMYRLRGRLEDMSIAAKETIQSKCSASEIAMKMVTICESLH